AQSKAQLKTISRVFGRGCVTRLPLRLCAFAGDFSTRPAHAALTRRSRKLSAPAKWPSTSVRPSRDLPRLVDGAAQPIAKGASACRPTHLRFAPGNRSDRPE